MSGHDYQAIVIGAGPGGYPCGIRLGQLGIKTLVVEKDQWGGVCLNVGCIPSKALITAGKRVEEIHGAKRMGIVVDGQVSVDMTRLQKWKGGIVDRLTKGVATLLKGNGVDTLVGEARLTGPHEVTVRTDDGERAITADHIVIATGSRPIEIPGFSFSDGPVLDSTKALALTEVPGHLVVVGGGYIGLELGQMYAKLGARVTVVEMLDQVLPGFDPEVVKVISRQLKKAKIKTLLGARAMGWESTDDGIAVEIQTPEGVETLAADQVLVTVGRRPNTEGLGLEELGIEMDGPFIGIDEQCRTNLGHVFAIGDVAGQPMLAHKASHEGELVAEVIAGKKVVWDVVSVPAVVFTDPEVSSVGLQEHEAREKGEILVGKVPFAAIGRALTAGETTGFVKVIVDAESKLVLGVTIIGPHASDLISEGALAVEMRAEAMDLGLTIHPHPTLGEGVMEAAKAALGEAIHILNR